MKVAILAGGKGTRLAEETDVRPKPMVEVGGRPILWHIMKHYERYGSGEFLVALGYKGDTIKRFFLDYLTLNGNLTVSLEDGSVTPHGTKREPWRVHLVDTGWETQTGGRVGRLRPWLEHSTFMLTYGDGVADIDLDELLQFHRSHGKLGTLTAVRPPSRFGEVVVQPDNTVFFTEKPQVGEGWINGGFMVFEPPVLDRIEGDETSLEADVLEGLAKDGELVAYRHTNFWQCMDTLRDLRYLRRLWESGNPPWVTW